MNTLGKRLKTTLMLGALALAATGCVTTPEPDCALAASNDLDASFARAKERLGGGCEAYFDAYFNELLETAEGDPQSEHKRAFSDFLLWSTDTGLLSKRQARGYYNRYFNVKFVSMMGDYNNCSAICPRQGALLAEMEHELADKEQGLLRVALDRDSYYRADRLFKETELVLVATCNACEAGP